MDKNELLEMINSTINNNGVKAITGDALNLALTSIVESMGSGSGTTYIYLPDAETGLTDEQRASNVEAYNAIMSAHEEGTPTPSFNIRENGGMGGLGWVESSVVTVGSNPGMYDGIVFFSMMSLMMNTSYGLKADGTTEVVDM